MKEKYPLKAGLFGTGLDAYWPRFTGLKERLENYLGQVSAKLKSSNAGITNLGLIDNPANALAHNRLGRLDAGGSFTEFYAIDFNDDVVLMGHDGPGYLAIAEGDSAAGPILETGNTNSRYRFPVGVKKFVNTWNSFGPAHHCAAGAGHVASKVRKPGELLNMEVVKVCQGGVRRTE